MTFKQAVEAASSVARHYRPGLQALRSNSHKIECSKTRRLTGSVNLDEALKAKDPQGNRWDYGIGFLRKNKEVAVWVEIHPANSESIQDVLSKLKWLKEWLNTDAKELRDLTEDDYYWLSTDGIAITQNSSHAKRLASAGLRGPMRVLKLE